MEAKEEEPLVQLDDSRLQRKRKSLVPPTSLLLSVALDEMSLPAADDVTAAVGEYDVLRERSFLGQLCVTRACCGVR